MLGWRDCYAVVMSTQSYAIIGTGALGGYYGARLAQAGQDVHFLVRGDVEHVQRHGLNIESMHGDFSLPKVQAYGDVSDMPKCDVVVVALKTTGNAALGALLPPVLKQGGVVLVLQNGLEPEAQRPAVVGAENVIGGLCFLCSNRVGPGILGRRDLITFDWASTQSAGSRRASKRSHRTFAQPMFRPKRSQICPWCAGKSWLGISVQRVVGGAGCGHRAAHVAP